MKSCTKTEFAELPFNCLLFIHISRSFFGVGYIFLLCGVKKFKKICEYMQKHIAIPTKKV